MLKRKQPERIKFDWALADKSPLQFLIQPEVRLPIAYLANGRLTLSVSQYI